MWESTEEQGSPQMTIWRLRIACWIRKATNSHNYSLRSSDRASLISK